MRRPWISLNLAVSADGKISSASRRPSGWTSSADHARLLDLRKNADAILVGRGTLETDRMTLVSSKHAQAPLRCIVSSQGQISADHPLFKSAGGPIHLLLTQPAGPIAAHPLAPHAILHNDSLAGFLQTLADKYHVKYLHCEGGGTLIRSLAELDTIDEFHLTLAGHTLFGGASAPTATGIPDTILPRSLEFEITRFEPHNDSGECFMSYKRRQAAPPDAQ